MIICLLYYVNTGLVPEEAEESNDGETSNEDSKLQDLPPCWGLDIVCGKGTDFNYGPWADRQRYCVELYLQSLILSISYCLETILDSIETVLTANVCVVSDLILQLLSV